MTRWRRGQFVYFRLVPERLANTIFAWAAEVCPVAGPLKRESRARVRKKLTDLLLDYQIVNEPHSHAERNETKAASGQTSIPVLVDGDVVLDDDDDIIPYLDKKYGAEVPK